MSRAQNPRPTDPSLGVDSELQRWESAFAGEAFFYGDEPGPIARRAYRYHRPWMRPEATALDAGCGEGQDLAFLAECGYAATGVEFTPSGAAKARRYVQDRGRPATVLHQDLREFLREPAAPAYDLVIAANCLQFLGAEAPMVLAALQELTAPGGVIGVSLFGREPNEPAIRGTVWFTPMSDLLDRFRGWQCLEAAQLWQWDVRSNRAQPFVTMIARKVPPAVTVPLGRA